jgi:large subunit ribosomal protein L24
MPIHASNVMIVDPKTGKPTRIRITRGKDGARERMAVKSGQTIK